MPRQLPRPGYPWKGNQLSHQTMDSVIQRINRPPEASRGSQALSRWFRRLEDDEYVLFRSQGFLVDLSVPDDETRNLLLCRPQLTCVGSSITNNAPSLWCIWSDVDVCSGRYGDFDLRPVLVHFPAYQRCPERQDEPDTITACNPYEDDLCAIKRFRGFWNEVSGRWECAHIPEDNCEQLPEITLVKILNAEQVYCCAYDAAIRVPEQGTEYQNFIAAGDNCSGVTEQCKPAGAGQIVKVWLVPACEVPADDCIWAEKIADCLSCDAFPDEDLQDRPVYRELLCGECCPYIYDPQRDISVGRSLTLKLETECRTFYVPLCWHPCATAYTFDPSLSGDARFGSPLTLPEVSGSQGVWVGEIECTGQQPVQLAGMSLDPPPDWEGVSVPEIWQRIRICQTQETGEPEVLDEFWYDNNGDMLPYHGPRPGADTSGAAWPCLLLTPSLSNNQVEMEECTYKYWVTFECAEVEVEGVQQVQGLLRIWHANHVTDSMTTPAGWTNDDCLPGSEEAYPLDVKLPYWADSTLTQFANACLSVVEGSFSGSQVFGQSYSVEVETEGGPALISPFAHHVFCNCNCEFNPQGAIVLPYPCDEDYMSCPGSLKWIVSW